ncbi:MAG: hypothetical protein RR131_09695 [Anaerovorax sp.]
MKKIIMLFLILTLSLSLSACKTDTKNNSDTKKKETTSQDNTKKEKKKEAISAPIALTTTYTHGTWVENVYQNPYLKLQFTLPENWTIQPEEYLAYNSDTTAEIYASNDLIIQNLGDIGQLLEMTAIDEPTQANTLIGLNNRAVMENKEITLPEFAETLKKGLLGHPTVKFDITDTSEEEFLNETYVTFSATATKEGMTQKFYLKNHENFILMIMITSPTSGGMSVENIASNFSGLTS